MSYAIMSKGFTTEFDTLGAATLSYCKHATRQQTVILLGPERLDGSREMIASYDPPRPEEPTFPQEAPRAVPQGGSVALYWYAIGQIDALDGMSRANDSDARQFSLYTEWSNVEMLPGLWRDYYDSIPE